MTKNLLQKKNSFCVRRRLTVLCLGIFLGFLAIPLFATAMEENTPKQEVVYVDLASDGMVQDIYVVNMFDLSADGQIIDYGDYTALRNLTNNDQIYFDNKTVKIDTKAGKFYYQGTLKENTLPWLFDIVYKLNGRVCSAQELAGKSGNLQISISVRENPACNSVFFENYALQIALTLDTEKCRNIDAPGATSANVGRNRSLTYTILAGQEKDIVLTSEVSDFTMEGISINGIPLTMDVEVNPGEYDEWNRQMQDLKDAVISLDDGANDVKDGVAETQDGAGDVQDGAMSLRDGVIDAYQGAAALHSGANDLYDGAWTLHDGTNEALNGVLDAQDGIADLAEGADQLADGMEETVDGAFSVYTGSLELQEGASDLYDGVQELAYGLEQLTEYNNDICQGAYAVFQQLTDEASKQINQGLSLMGMEPVQLTPENYAEILNTLSSMLSAGGAAYEDMLQGIAIAKAQLYSYYDFYAGIVDYTNRANDAFDGAVFLAHKTKDLADGAEELCVGANDLYTGLAQLADGGGDLISGIIRLQDGMLELSDGVWQLNDGAKELLSGTADLQDGTISLCDGLLQAQDGSIELLDGAIQLHDGTIELYDGVIKLTDGTFTFRDQTSHLDQDLQDQLSDAVQNMLSGDFPVCSFVSPLNTNVDSVQFVMSTTPIEENQISEAEPESEPVLSFWQKILRLFGLY